MGPADIQRMMLMRSSLPQAPGMVSPVPQQPMVPPPGGPQPYQNSTTGGVLEGIGKFLNSYRASQDQIKERAASEVDRDLKLIQMGIPIDNNKVLKNMKKAGIEIDTEAFTPTQSLAQQTATTQGVPQGMSSPTMAMPMGQPEPRQPIAPPTGIWDRMKASMGIGQSEVSTNSPGGAWLQQMQQMGQGQMQNAAQGVKLQNEQQQIAMLKAGIEKAVLIGDPRGIELAKKTGLLQKTPFDELREVAKQVPGMTDTDVAAQYLGIQLGHNKVREALFSMAEKNAARFGGDQQAAMKYYSDIYTTGKSDVKPARTLQEELDVMKQTNELQKLRPFLPENIARLQVEAAITGNRELQQQLDKIVMSTAKGPDGVERPNFPTQAQIDVQYKEANLQQGRERLRQGWAGLSIDQARVNQAWQIHADNFRLNAAQTMSNAAGRQFDDFYRLATQKDALPEQVKMALQGMANSLNQLHSIEVPIGKDANGKEIMVNLNPSTYTVKDVAKWYQIGERPALQEIKGEFTGTAPQVEKTEYDKMMEQWSQAVTPILMQSSPWMLMYLGAKGANKLHKEAMYGSKKQENK